LKRKSNSTWITIGSLVALFAGVGAGLAVHRTGNAHLQSFLISLRPIATIWLAALQIVVFPLIVSVLIVSIASSEDAEKPGRMGALTLGCFVSILCVGAAFGLAAGFLLVGGFRIHSEALATLYPVSGTVANGHPAGPLSAWQWLSSESSNFGRRVATEFLVPLLAATVLAAIIIRNLSPEPRARAVRLAKATNDGSLLLLRWLFWALPVVVFILISDVSSRTGSLMVEGIGYYMLAKCGTLLAFTGVQYLFAWTGGGTSMARFARSLWAGQTAAVTTRSSLASLPPLIDGALNRMGLPRAVGTFVLPLSVSIFKASESIDPPFRLIFLAYLFNVRLTSPALLAFVIGALILSFAVAGVPGSGALHTIPLYLALGIPLEGIILLNSVETIPDIFETLLNVTADMTVATVVARFLGSAPIPTSTLDEHGPETVAE
jgi:Na+/H+-dicarboxylate symporter